MFSKILKSLAVAASLATLPIAAQALTITNTTDTYTILAIQDENGATVTPTALPLSLDPNGIFAFIGFAFNGNGTMSGTGFMAMQDFVNNTGETMVFAGSNQFPATGFVNAYINVTIGGLTTALSLSGNTFSVLAGDTFTITWGAENVVSNASLFNIRVAAVPLPAGALLLLTGLAGLAAARRRKTA